MKFFSLFACLLLAGMLTAQQANPDQKYAAAQLKEDVQFLQKQIFNAHANPFTNLSEVDYRKQFEAVEAQLKDSMNQTDFYKLVRPLFSWLGDEHCGITLKTPSTEFTKTANFLPFTLISRNGKFLVDKLLAENPGLSQGDTIVALNGIPVEQVIDKCAAYSSGFLEQRREAAVQRLGLLLNFAYSPQTSFTVTKPGGKALMLFHGAYYQDWVDYFTAQNKQTNCTDRITYHKIGQTGYIKSCSFNLKGGDDRQRMQTTIDSIFDQIKSDQVDRLIIDVSQNGGGNSVVGNFLIDNFCDKKYQGYACNWKRSDEYLALITSWGMKNEEYEKTPTGALIRSDAGWSYPRKKNKNRFNGPVFVIVGDRTFSSAIMFGTLVKDNQLAKLAGETPTHGHPSHFGELYNSKLPNTQMEFRFGVKEWIRPAGNTVENVLTPDIPIDLQKNSSPEDLVRILEKY